MTPHKQHTWWRAALALPVVAASLAFTGAASAQTTFQASVNATNPPFNACPNAANFCGSANIAGYGSATFTAKVPPVTHVSSAPCPPPFPSGSRGDFRYTMTDTFKLSDGSTLVLDEWGLVCVPGNNQSGAAGGAGDPRVANGCWTVDILNEPPTGQFAGLTGSGTDVAYLAGGRVSATYSSGTLAPCPEAP